MTKVVFGLSLVSVTSFAAWALAQGAPPAPAPAEKADKAATLDLMRTVVPKAAYDAILDQMYAQLSTAMQAQGGKGIPASKQKELKAAVQECLPYDDLLNWSADVYTKYFTRKEIDDLAAFYKTPTGKKVSSLLPTLSGEVGAKIAPILMGRIGPSLKKHGIQI
jgi:hypothetical protein